MPPCTHACTWLRRLVSPGPVLAVPPPHGLWPGLPGPCSFPELFTFLFRVSIGCLACLAALQGTTVCPALCAWCCHFRPPALLRLPFGSCGKGLGPVMCRDRFLLQEMFRLCFATNKCWDTWVAWSVKCPALDFGAGLNLGVLGSFCTGAPCSAGSLLLPPHPRHSPFSCLCARALS